MINKFKVKKKYSIREFDYLNSYKCWIKEQK